MVAYIRTLAGVVLGGQPADGQIEGAGGRDVSEGDALGKVGARSEGGHIGRLG
jgi:hypothetical protein